MSSINYAEKIPNNVNLVSDRTLQRALEHWQPHFLEWWKTMGPSDFQAADVVSAHRDLGGRAGLGDLRRGEDARLPLGHLPRRSATGSHHRLRRSDGRAGVAAGAGRVPLDAAAADRDARRHRARLGRAAALLGHTCPSLYDLRNLFQVNVEEGRHLWAMVYLLHAYFGRDGREEAEELLARHSGDADKPRILTTFNEPISDWLSFYCFTYFTDRDGKYQLKSLAESAFDPLSRTCRFMLTEEAHHMFVGETGIGRVVKRTLEVMKELGTDDPARVRAAGAVDLPTLQKYLNFWCSSSLDLFGSEISSNSAANFAHGLKGRPDESQYEDHVLREKTMALLTPEGEQHVPMLNALNEVMRESYLKDCEIGLKRWNRQIERAGFPFPPYAALLALPPLHWGMGGPAGGPAGKAAFEGGIRKAPAGLDSVRGRQDIRALAPAEGRRTRQDGGVDRAA